MINFDDYTNENKTEHNSKWPHIPDHPYRLLIVGGSGSGKANALLNSINNQIGLNHSSDIDFKDFMKIYKKCTEEPYSFLVNDTTLRSDNPLRFRKNLLE